MNEPLRHVPRVLVATVTASRGRDREGPLKAVLDEIAAASFVLVRSVYVNGEPHFIEQLVSNVSNSNEADAIVLIGGTGLGPHDKTCEALDAFLGHKMEGFGEAYRQLLRDEIGPSALLARATAGVYNQCLVFAMTGRTQHVQRAMKNLIVPTLVDAVDLATGRSRTLA
jgi:molybdenum cofactor biosynthesis protein B